MKSKTNNYDFSIIIPAKNEAKRIVKTLDELARQIRKSELGKVEVLVVAGKSDDNTVEIAHSQSKKFQTFQVVEEKRAQGKGHSVQLGMLKAQGDYRVFMDADLATPMHHLDRMVKHLRGGADIVIGQRDLSEIHKGVLRRLISMGGNLTVRVLLGMKYQDTQCGFKGFQADVAKDLFSVQTILGWGFDMEILAVAHKRHYQVAKIDIDDWKDVAGGNLEGKAAQAALSSLKDILTIRWNLWTGRYKK